MTITYNNTFVNGTSLVTGPYEKRGPLSRFFDKTYEEFYFNRPTWEQAESKLIEDSVDILLKKIGKTKFDIDVHVSGDLLNQLASTNYASSNIGIPLLGVYSACATSMEGVIIGANMVDKGIVKNCIASVSSHNEAAEKQMVLQGVRSVDLYVCFYSLRELLRKETTESLFLLYIYWRITKSKKNLKSLDIKYISK